MKSYRILQNFIFKFGVSIELLSGAQRGYLKCSIRGTINQIRNRFYKSIHLMSNANLLIFNCLTSNINLFNFNCLRSNFCFPKNIFFASRRERMFMDARPQFRVFNSTGKMMTCYLRDTNKFSRKSPHYVHEHTKM